MPLSNYNTLNIDYKTLISNKVINQIKVRMMSNYHAPYALGDTLATKAEKNVLVPRG